MNRIALGLTAAFLVALSAFATEYRDTSFTVNLPANFGPPTKASASAQNIETETWFSKAPTGEAVVVSMSKMPSKIADPAKLMDSTRDSLLKSVNGTLESEQTIAGDMPSRLLVFRSGSAFLRSRLFVNNDPSTSCSTSAGPSSSAPTPPWRRCSTRSRSSRINR